MSDEKTKDDCIHGCGRVAEIKGECKPCRGGFYYWNGQPASKRLKRRNQLDVLSSRLDTHFDTRGKQNKTPLVQPAPHETGTKITVYRERRKT